MSITREYDVPLAKLSTFRLGGTAKEVVTIETENDLKEVFYLMPQGQKWFVVGGGSNIVFPDSDTDTLIIRMAIQGIRSLTETEDNATIAVGAGVAWDEVVAFAVERELAGIEALSYIPGTSGATPVQNVGAYGVEIRDVLVSLRAFDIEKKEFVVLQNNECKFGYRDSLFKNEAKGKYIITEITLVLSRDLPNVPQYPGVAEYLAEHGIRAASLADIRKAIISIRTKKLPDPSVIASVGSFFKNTFVPLAQAEKLKAEYPTLAVFPVHDALHSSGEAMAKVGTGSLIDTLGWKGKRVGNLSLYSGNAMVVVNEGGATRRELADFIALVQSEVEKKYGIRIEPEPELLEF